MLKKMREKLPGSEAQMDFIQSDGLLDAWVDTKIRSEVTLPIEIKPDVEYIIFEYETNTEFIGCMTTLRISVVEGYPELFPNEEITVKRTPGDGALPGILYPWLYPLPK